MTTANQAPMIDIEIPHHSQRIALLNIAQAIQWADHEVEAWQWINKCKSQLNHIANSDLIERISQVSSALSNLQGVADTARKNTSDNKNPDRFKHAIQTLYVEQGLPLANSPVGAFLICHASASTEMSAVGALAAILPPKNKCTHALSELILGIVDARLHLTGLDDATPHISQAASAELARWNSQMAEFLDSHNKKAIDLTDKLQESIDHQATELMSWTNNTTEFHNKCVDKLATTLSNFHEHMTLSAPARYWMNKRKHHKRQSWLWGIFFFSLLLAGAFSTIQLSFYVLGMHELVLDTVKQLLNGMTPTTQPSGNVWLERIATVGVVFTFLAWSLRVISRVWLSNLHMASDADERVTMIHTYLAMLKRKAAIEEAHRTLVLNAVFRPGSTGLVKTDAITHALLDTPSIGRL
ncbi:MAG: hypothetical protein IT442_05325 [Phycisphaeraceae bacterium]|nr:hypothetical protein [Phycisphaeraceae bacterium]